MAATPRQLADYVTAFAAYAAILHMVPGPWQHWSKGAVLDNWTWTHIAWGYIGQRWGQSLGQQVALASANEVIEAIIRRRRPDWTWGTPESPANVVADVAANAVGWWLGSMHDRRGA